ncbi:TlpA family protein disulfide reductase [Flavobacterium suzhouense]|uniref:TlpA family protein disulfide reductase n=1 Tax=Flavobacterium suzhouense TaxID=1529638 RepID=A0ABW5NVI0_9FLAO
MKHSIIFVLVFSLFVMSANAQIKPGDQLPKLTLTDVSGKSMDLQPIKGKVVLVDFWASWCGPCRVTNKKLVKLYEKYKIANLEIVGISLDKDKSKWLAAVKKDKITYMQLNDPEGFEAKSAIAFGVEQMPASYLFDAAGRLVAINPTEDQIKNEVNKKK